MTKPHKRGSRDLERDWSRLYSERVAHLATQPEDTPQQRLERHLANLQRLASTVTRRDYLDAVARSEGAQAAQALRQLFAWGR